MRYFFVLFLFLFSCDQGRSQHFFFFPLKLQFRAKMEPPRPAVTPAELLAQRTRLAQITTPSPTLSGGNVVIPSSSSTSSSSPVTAKAVPAPPQPDLVRASPSTQREIMLLFQSFRRREGEVEQLDVEEIYLDETL